MKPTCIVLTLLALSGCAVTEDPANLIINGRFGKGATCWKTLDVSGTPAPSMTVRASVFSRPALTLRVDDGTASVVQQLAPLTESGFYELTVAVHVKAVTGKFRVGVGYEDDNGPTIAQSNHIVRASAKPQLLRTLCYTGHEKFCHDTPVKVFLELAGPGEAIVHEVKLVYLDTPRSTTQVTEKVTAHEYGDGWAILEIEGRNKGTTCPVVRTPQIQHEQLAPTPRERKHGVVTFVSGNREGVLPDYRPTAAERTASASCFISPGEYELVTFVIKPVRDLRTLTFKIGDFVSPAGASFKSDSSDLYVGDITAEQDGLYGSENTQFIRRVKWLRPTSSAEAKAGENIQLFVDVHAPQDTPPGQYIAPMTIVGDHGKPAQLQLHVDVLDLKLNRARNWGAYVYGWHGMPYKRQNALLKLRELRRHGMTQCVISPLAIQNRPGFVAGQPGSPDFGAYDEFIALYQQAGFPDPPVLGLEGWLFSITESLDRSLLPKYKFEGRRLIGVMPDELPDDYKALAHRNLRRIYDHALEQSWPPFYAYLADEPWSRGKTRLGALLMYPTARKAAGSLRTATSLYEAMGPFEGTVDFNYMHYVHPTTSAESAAGLRKEAERLDMKVLGMAWSMAVEDTFFNHSRVAGFIIEKCGLKGMMPWVQWVIGPADDLSQPADPYRDAQHYFKGGPWARYDKAGRISRALNLLGYREAIDDSRYVNTARSLARRARASFDSKLRQQGRAAEKRIDELLQQVPYKKEFDEKTKPWDDARATQLRRQIANIAIELQAAVGIDELWQQQNVGLPAGQAATSLFVTP